VRRLTINVAAWAFGTILFTTLWVLTEWQEHGALKSFGQRASPASGIRRSGPSPLVSGGLSSGSWRCASTSSGLQQRLRSTASSSDSARVDGHA
jgi:hypothetical protein